MTQTDFHWLMAAQTVHTLMPFGTVQKARSQSGAKTIETRLRSVIRRMPACGAEGFRNALQKVSWIYGLGKKRKLVAGARRVIIAMDHTTKEGRPKILRKCTLPLTGAGVVNMIVTEMAVIEVTPNGLLLREVAPGVTPDEVQKLTEAQLRVAPDLKTIRL